jgi:hypothetical protein
MVWQRVQIVLLAGTIAAVAALPARSNECCAPASSDSCMPAPSMCTVRVTECVPETYQYTRTSYRRECRQENYTAYRTECTAETRTRTCTVNKMVPEVRTVMHTECITVPCVEERTVMQQFVTCKPCTTMCRKCVDRGHWECREVPCHEGCLSRMKKHFHKHHDCCESSCEPCAPPPTKTVKVWVPCKVWEETPVTTYKRVCECRPVTCKVTTCKREQRQVQRQVTCMRCVPETHTENYTVMVPHQVAYQATRTVSVCVPCQETVTACRMVSRVVEKQVPAAPACGETTCCKPNGCENSCASTCCKSHHHHCKHHCAGLFHRHHSCCE